MTLSFKPALAKLATGLAATLGAPLGAPGNRTALIIATAWILAACSHESRPAAPGNPLGVNPASASAAGVIATAASGALGKPGTAGQPNVAGTPAATAPNSASPPGPPAKADAATIDIIVGRNDTLDRVFRKLNLSLTDLANLRAMPGIKTHMDNLRLGESLHIVYKDDELDGFERRLNDEETLKVTRGPDGLHADVLQNPLEGRTRTIRGVIDSSLFEAVTGAGAHDQTAVNLADIFQWDIDFVLDIQPRDSFTVTYRELYQNGVYVKDGPVLAASFVNQGRSYYAVRYVDSESAARYFTPDGRSLHKAFLRAPVEFTRISSKFNSARYHPILNLIRAHKGIDYAAPMGTPVRAAGDGRVSYAGPKGGYGNVVELEHSRSITTVYGHLSRFAKGTRAGAHVTQGQVIAYVGMTGLATGPHLHYEYRVNGVFKNPQTVPLPDASPIEARFREDFLAKSAPLLATLEAPIGPALVSR
jgi:murein DD-endopeptidase MepM/ murein hydrolase activator NlpD